MSTLQQQYELITKIHELLKIYELLPQINQKYGLEIEVKSDKIIYYDEINAPSLKTKDYQIGDVSMLENTPYWSLEKALLLIQAPQLRQILVGLKEVLGKNPEYNEMEKVGEVDLMPNFEGKIAQRLYTILSARVPKSQAEALCQKWLGGLNPLFDREPETVLTELVGILENLLKN